jgi:serine kinase of HPr protein (carbohydrate metabolism regulator)
MTLKELIKNLDLAVFNENNALDREIVAGYCSDLLSDVMGNAQNGCIWITIQTHPNTVAVAVLKDIPAIILTSDRKPQPEAIEHAKKERIALLGTKFTSFEIAGKLFELGVRRS